MLERSVNGERESYVYDNNVVSMSKAGDDYFYMLDELGTGMYLTGTDGTVSDTYAYDEFGRSLDPCTGKEKPQYQKQGNILQPLAFTGYQEDEVSGLMFAQARHYDATSGRFQSEDLVKGFTSIPFTLNHYSYCFGNPVGFVDRNGKLFDWAADAWDKACDIAGDVKDTVSDGVDKACDTASDFWEENKDTFIKVGATAAVAGVLVAGAVVAPGAVGVVCAAALASGTVAMGVDVVAQVKENNGFSNYNLDQTIIAGTSGALSGALSCATANPLVLFSGNALINGASYAATQYVNNEPITSYGVGVNCIIGGLAGLAAGNSHNQMLDMERALGWNSWVGEGTVFAAETWRQVCSETIIEETIRGLFRSTITEGVRYTISSWGSNIDNVRSTINGVLSKIDEVTETLKNICGD